jgi:SAM-dependent methyltransferase
MRPTASRQTRGKYEFGFSRDGPYGHTIRLLDGLGIAPGLVLDLGCGYGAIAEPLVERGYSYVGVDIDPDGLAVLADRGLETHKLDLAATDELPERLGGVIGARPLAAVLVLDVLEHLVDPGEVLRALHSLLACNRYPPLIVSVPNVAHVDIGAKLTFGMWDVTPTGLLDHTHVSLFTDARLRREMRAAGFLELAADDVRAGTSDQHFPHDHPALAAMSPVAQIMRTWRAAADPHGTTIQFVRGFTAADLRSAPDPEEQPEAAKAGETRTFTVVLRTQGKRLAGLRDALTCLAAQTDDDFDVLLMVHTDDSSMTDTVNKLVGEFDPGFASRIAVSPVPEGGGRCRPLNQALELVSSLYVAFLDDDDVITGDWIEAFASVAGDGAILRSQSAARLVSPSQDPDRVPAVVSSGLEFRFAPRFDLAQHLWQNQTPICSYAVPRGMIEAFGLRFDEEFVVLEDWEFLLRCASLGQVRDTGRLTSIVQLMIDTGESSRSVHTGEIWKALERVEQDRLNSRPLLLPPGAVGRLVELHGRVWDLELSQRELLRRESELRAEHERLERIARDFEALNHDYSIVVGSRRWRMLGPPQRALGVGRRMLRTLRARGTDATP